jgi:hypothetical protein
MPGETERRAPASVLWVSGEEAVDVAVRQRMEALGADLDRVKVPRPDAPLESIDDIESVLEEVPELGLLVVDPVKAFVRYDDADEIAVRRELSKVVRIAQTRRVPALIIRHWRKSAGRADERGAGSLSYGAVPRSVLAVGERDGQRTLFVTTASYAPSGVGFRFDLLGRDDGPPSIAWRERVQVEPDAFSQDAAGGRADVRAEIREHLADGPQPAKAVKEAVATACNCDQRTVERAAKSLRVVSERVGRGNVWSLPQHDSTTSPEECRVSSQEPRCEEVAA